MTITYGELGNRVLRVLDGFDADGTTPSESITEHQLLDAISTALVAILPWVPKRSVNTLAANGTTVLPLPDDFYEVEAVVDSSSGEVYPKTELLPGNYVGDTSTGSNNWMLFPHGSMTFSKEPTVDITFYYLAEWTKLSDPQDEDELETPDFAMVGMSLYAAAMIFLSGAVSIAEIKQFATKVDSGNPEHNPMKAVVDYLLKLFSSEMNRHPKHQRV